MTTDNTNDAIEPTDADTEGHAYLPRDERDGGFDPPISRAKGFRASVADAAEDDDGGTEGHRSYSSNVGVDFEADDAKGGEAHTSGEETSADAEGQQTDDGDDEGDGGTEGHRAYSRNVGVDFD